MTEQHPNVIRYMRGIQAFNENDLDTVKEYFSEDIIYRIPGRNPIAGDYRGIEQLGKALQLVRDLSEGTLTVEPQIVLADDQAVMVYARVNAQRKGKTIDIDQAYLYRFNGDGKVIEGRAIPVDLYAYDDFWS